MNQVPGTEGWNCGRPARTRLAIAILLLSHACPLNVRAQDTVRIATYNLLNYPDTDGVARIPRFRSALSVLDPDVLVAQEMQSQAGVDLFRDSVLNYYRPGTYRSGQFHDGYDTDNSLFFKPDKVELLSSLYIPTTLRDIARYALTVPRTEDTLFVFSVHLKAGSTASDIAERLTEATTLRDYLNTLPQHSKFIIVGDFNASGSGEACLAKLEEDETTNNGRAKDPLNAAGTWYNNYGFRYLHTQSTRVRSFGGGATGGLDDRFDLILTSYGSVDSMILASTYHAFGNDGNHFNDSINRLPNTAVPDSAANGLHYASDHLPVVCSFVFGRETSPVTVSVALSSGWNLASIPVSVRDTAVRAVFPSVASATIAYQNGTYSSIQRIGSGTGYWVRLDSASEVTFTGLAFYQDTVEIRKGWNLIGSLTHSYAVSGAITEPGGILCPGTFYTFLGGRYYGTPTLDPGNAYWVRACADGKLILGK